MMKTCALAGPSLEWMHNQLPHCTQIWPNNDYLA